jgi:hypothetical protein
VENWLLTHNFVNFIENLLRVLMLKTLLLHLTSLVGDVINNWLNLVVFVLLGLVLLHWILQIAYIMLSVVLLSVNLLGVVLLIIVILSVYDKICCF